MVKKFRVGFWYTVYGTTEVKAETTIEAENKITIQLSKTGLKNLKYNQHDQDYGSQDGEEIK